MRAKHVLRNVKGIVRYKLYLKTALSLNANSKHDFTTTTLVDANWAGCADTRKLAPWAPCALHCGETQSALAQSSADSEFYGLCSRVSDTVHARSFFWNHAWQVKFQSMDLRALPQRHPLLQYVPSVLARSTPEAEEISCGA